MPADMDLSALPADTPIWIVSLAVLVGVYGTFSKHVAQIKGPLGAAARWWESRQIRAVQRKRSLDETIDAYVDKRMEGVSEDIATLRAQVGELRADLERERRARREERADLTREHANEIEKARERERLQHRYIVLMTGALRGIEIWAADNGLTLPPPPLLTYPEWVAEQDGKPTARNPPGE